MATKLLNTSEPTAFYGYWERDAVAEATKPEIPNSADKVPYHWQDYIIREQIPYWIDETKRAEQR